MPIFWDIIILVTIYLVNHGLKDIYNGRSNWQRLTEKKSSKLWNCWKWMKECLLRHHDELTNWGGASMRAFCVPAMVSAHRWGYPIHVGSASLLVPLSTLSLYNPPNVLLLYCITLWKLLVRFPLQWRSYAQHTHAHDAHIHSERCWVPCT